MKKAEIVVGKVYVARVGTNKRCPVRIDSESEYGGWDATNLRTNRAIHVRSAQRFHREWTTADGHAEAAAERTAMQREQEQNVMDLVQQEDGSDGVTD